MFVLNCEYFHAMYIGKTKCKHVLSLPCKHERELISLIHDRWLNRGINTEINVHVKLRTNFTRTAKPARLKHYNLIGRDIRKSCQSRFSRIYRNRTDVHSTQFWHCVPTCEQIFLTAYQKLCRIFHTAHCVKYIR